MPCEGWLKFLDLSKMLKNVVARNYLETEEGCGKAVLVSLRPASGRHGFVSPLPFTSDSLWTLSCHVAPHKWFIVHTVLSCCPSQVVHCRHCPVMLPLTSGSLCTLSCHVAPDKWFIVDTVLSCCPSQVVHCAHWHVTLPFTSGSLCTLSCHVAPHTWFIVHTVMSLCPSQLKKHQNGSPRCLSDCKIDSDGDSVAVGSLPLPPPPPLISVPASTVCIERSLTS